MGDPHRPISSRVRCIALLWRIDHSTGRSRLCALYRVPAFGTTWGGAAEAHRPADGIFVGMAGQGTPLWPRPANRTTTFSRTRYRRFIERQGGHFTADAAMPDGI